MKNQKLVPITGNTYPVKDSLRAIGGKWNPDEKAWFIPADKAEEARKIVAEAPANDPNAKCDYRPTKCVVCGHKATGRYGDVIYRNGECRDCYEERKMGY